MDRIQHKSEPRLFDKEIFVIQRELAEYFPWLNYSLGICETLNEVKNGKKFISANLYMGKGQYVQIMPCEELGNFSFFTLKDPQEKIKNMSRIRSPFSLIIWYDTTKVSLPTDERNTESIKAQILGVLEHMKFPSFQILRVYEKPQNVFSDFSYEHIDNQFLMAPYAGLRIDGTIEANIPCVPNRLDFHGSYDLSYDLSFDR